MVTQPAPAFSGALAASLPRAPRLPSIPFLYFLTGDCQAEKARTWAANLDAVIQENSRGNRRIAIDRVAPIAVMEMQRLGYQIFDGFEAMEVAREVRKCARRRAAAALRGRPCPDRAQQGPTLGPASRSGS